MRKGLERQLREQARADFYAARAANLYFRIQRNPLKWAEEERWIAQGASPLSRDGDIRYRANVMPWCAEPLEGLVAPDVQVTVLWWASGMAKSEVAANGIGHSMHEAPKNCFVVYPKDENRDKFSRDVVQRMIDSTPALRRIVAANKSRDSGNTIQYKRFHGGSLYLVGAGSSSNFRGPRAGFLYCGEVDDFPENVGEQGDPIELAFKRCEGFEDSIKIIEGTGTLAPTTDAEGNKIYRSRIQFWYDQSDQRKWFCPCRKCGHEQWLKWEQIWFPAGRPWQGVYLCERCDADHNDKQRVRMVMEGRWKPTAAFHGIRGYWLNGINATLPAEKGFRNKMHQFYADEQRARKGKDPRFSLRVWRNTFLAQVVEPVGEQEAPPEWKPLFDRREPYGKPGGQITVPEPARILTAAVDVQKYRLEVEWKAWAQDETSWGIDHVVIPGEVEDMAVWMELSRELKRKFRHESGVQMELSMGLIDAGRWPDWVLKFLQLRTMPGRIRACRGSSIFPHPVIDTRLMRIAKQLRGHWVGPDAAKDTIYTRLRLAAPEKGGLPEGWMHFPESYGVPYFEQLTSEKVTVTYKGSEELRRYRNEEKKRNETLDLNVYNLAAVRIRRWPWQVLDVEFEAAAKEKAAREGHPPAGPEPERKKKPMERRKKPKGAGFLGRWKR